MENRVDTLQPYRFKKYIYLFDYVENTPESILKEVEKQWLPPGRRAGA